MLEGPGLRQPVVCENPREAAAQFVGALALTLPLALLTEGGQFDFSTPLLLGLGVDSLSMTPAWLPSVKYLIRSMSLADARVLAEEAMTLSSPAEIYARCDAFYRARVRLD